MKNKIIPLVLTVICLASIQFAYAEIEFSFEFGSKGTANDEFDNPTDLILDKNGKQIYVVDSANNRIGVFEDDKDFERNYGSFCNIASIGDCNDSADGADADGDGQFNAPFGITRDARGQFYVVDSDNERVQIFDDDGKFKSKFGSSDSSADDYLDSARGIAVQESTREILVSNIGSDSISVFNADGDFLFKFDTFDGRDDFKNPTNMVIDNSEQMLYVSDSGNDRIISFELVTGTSCPDGTEKVVDGVCFVEKFGSSGSGDGEFDDPNGLAYDEENDLLYVADSDNNRIQVFELVDGNVCPDGREEIVDGVCFVEKFGSSGSGDGEFDDPNGLAYDEKNDLLYVADSDNDRIQALSLSTEPASLLPNRPTGLEASAGSPTMIILSWTEPEQNKSTPAITGYKIEYKFGSGKYITISEDTKSTTTSFIHEGLDSGETYSYRVYSINSEGESATFARDSVKPEHTKTPTALTAAAIGPNQVKLFWLPPSETFGQNIAGYVVKREIVMGVYEDIGDTNSETRSFVVNNLATDKTYTFAVSAKIGFGFSGESPTASATPREDSVNVIDNPITSITSKIAKPSPPIKLNVAVVSSTQNNLTWSAPVEDGNTEITGYKIEVKRNNGSYTTLVSDTESTARTYSHENLVTDSKYTYKVSAINAIGVSEPSNEFTATPKSLQVQISPLGKLRIDEGKRLSFTVKLTDSSVKDVVFSLDKNPPAGAKITSSTGAFSWTPSSSDGGKTYSLDIVAKKNGLSDRETITITVNDIVAVTPPTPKPDPVAKPKELGIASFVDESKDPQSYVERYDTEPAYKEWFDENFAEYDSIYQAVGLKEPIPEEPVTEESVQIPASFVDESKDPQSYVERYDTEPAYKEWFDENFAEYDSIYQAVGLKEPIPEEPVTDEPVTEEKKFGICGTGTKLTDGVCTAVKLPTAKPWWQFW